LGEVGHAAKRPLSVAQQLAEMATVKQGGAGWGANKLLTVRPSYPTSIKPGGQTALSGGQGGSTVRFANLILCSHLLPL
jgi:hypothetical protein